MEMNEEFETDLDAELAESWNQCQRFFKKKKTVTRNRRIALGLTLVSLGLFSPVTVPYFAFSYYKQHQRNKLEPECTPLMNNHLFRL